MRENTFKNRGMSLLLVMVIMMTSIMMPDQHVAAATSSNIKIFNFIKILVPAAGLNVDTTQKDPYLTAAMAAGIVKEGDFTDTKAYLTRTDAAVLLNRADEYLHGDTVDSKLLSTVLSKRISDINVVPEAKREAVAKVYIKGFIVGKSNGLYTQNRSFSGSDHLATGDAKKIVAMLNNTKNRASISPDGQVIRTTNLPKNAKDYPYILAAFPNSFYEMKFMYQRVKYYFKPQELIDYASPARFKDISFHGKDMQSVLDKYEDDWIMKVENNLKYRLNVDYRTVNDTWVNNLRNTYTIYGDPIQDKHITDVIKNYIKVVKTNKITIQSKVISVEPSTLYKRGTYYIRAYVKFKVDYNGTKLTADDLLLGNKIYLPKLKKNTWFDGVYDIEIGTMNGSSDGSDYYVTNDALEDWND